MIADMQPVRVRRARATPEFVELCKTLYGDLIDPQVIWDDVFKAAPDSADVHAPVAHGGAKRQAMRGIGLTGAVVGGYLGVREGVHGVKALRSAKKLVDPALRRPALASAHRKLGVAGLLGVTDSTEIGALGSDIQSNRKKTGTLQPVGKSVASEVMGAAHKVKNGYLKLWRPAAKVVSATTPKASSAAGAAEAAGRVKNNATHAGRVARSTDVGRMLGTHSGKIVAGGVAGAGALKANKAIQSSKGGMEYVPDEYGKSADGILWSGEFSKFDDDKHLAFGWASVVAENGQPVVDKQGDYIAPEDIEDAAYAYVHKSRVGGDNHQRNGSVPHKVSDLVESMVFTDDKVAKMGLPDDFPRGWWVGFKVHDPTVWSEVRKGNRTGFSIHGRGIRTEQSLDELMGYADAAG